MGMLLTYRKGYWPDGDPQAGERKPARKSKADWQAEAEALGLDTSGTIAELQERIEAHRADQPEGSPYDELTDEQVLEAYLTTFPEGEATERDAQVVELRAVNAYRDTFDADPEAGKDE